MIQKLNPSPASPSGVQRLVSRHCPSKPPVRQVAVSRESLRHVKRGTLEKTDQARNTNFSRGKTAAVGPGAVLISVPRPSKAAGAGAMVPSSLRVPVTRSNREFLRAKRAAELAAWQPVLEARREALGRASLRSQISQLTRDFQKESWAYGALACVSAAAVGYAVWNSFHLLENWPMMLKTVQQWLA